MWEKLSHFILRQRAIILVVMLVVTGFMGWMAKSHLELSYKYARVLPTDDSMYIAYEKFKAKYGEDGNVLVIGFKDTNMFQLKKYQDWYDLTDSISKIEGIENVMSTARLYNMKMNDSINMFDVVPVVSRRPESQDECDSIKKVITHLPFYEGLILNKKEMVTVMAVTFTQKDLNTQNRLGIVNRIRGLVNNFGTGNKEEMHISGMPWIRSEYMRKIAGESSMLLILSVLATALILFIFFRYFNAVFFSLIIVIVGLIWSLGTIALFGYKITVLSGLIPSLIVIIGIPNCIFLINKYQEELVAHGNKTRALSRMVQKVGLSNFLANITTSIGFGVFYFTNSSLLVEFGVVAAINVMTTYFIALVLTPIAFSFLPPPKPKQMKHLSGSRINKVLNYIDKLVHHKRSAIYIGITIATIIAGLGFFKVKVNGYVVDDLPQKDPIYVDLKFFEKNFNGILPFELVVEVKPQLTDSIRKAYAASGKQINPDDFAADTLGPKNIFIPDGDVLFSIDTLEKIIQSRPEFSRAVSLTEAIKFANQALNNGKSKAYRIPTDPMGQQKLLTYYLGTKEHNKGNAESKQKISTFIDSTMRSTRISFQMADVGSDSAQRIVSHIKPVVDSIFPRKYFHVDMTGHSLMFLRSFHYMLHHLFVSLLIAIGLILLLGMALFRSVWIIVLSKLPCLIPLVMTAGIMGYLGIPFKSSTILIFSIAFGISSDGTIYILTEYRHQLRKLSAAKASKAVSMAIRETGLSMIYTNIILFFGFSIFMVSSFGGTVALGVLLSITLVISLCTNLVLLPCLLLSLEKRAATRALMKEPLIEIYDEEEDIDAEKLKIHYHTSKE